jgi:hypothetical protein
MIERAYIFIAQVVDVKTLPDVNADQDRITAALTVAFSITGAIALLVITLAGFKYITTQGNPQEVAKAKNAIIYALVGLVISILAVAIIQFAIRTVT